MALPYDVDGTWVDSGASYTAGELRRADAALFSQAGVASGLAVSVDGSDVVTITAGQAAISGEDAVTGTGIYRVGIPAAVTGSLAARDATNPRIDLVVFRQMDTDVVGAHAARTSRIQIIPGTPAATPAVPSRPTMAIELGRITVPKSGAGAASVNSAFRVQAKAVGVPLSAYFKGSIDTATALAAANYISYTAKEDSSGTWSTNQWFAPYAGLYRVIVQHKWNGTSPTTAPNIQVRKNGAAVVTSPNYPTAPVFGGFSFACDIRVASGDGIAIYLAQGGFTTQVDAGTENNFLTIEYKRP